MKNLIYTIAAAATFVTLSNSTSAAYQTRTITIIEDGECYYFGRRFTCEKPEKRTFYKRPPVYPPQTSHRPNFYQPPGDGPGGADRGSRGGGKGRGGQY